MLKMETNYQKPQKSFSNGGRPLCSVSLDLDNMWSYLKSYGDSDWKRFPSYLDVFMPIVIDFFNKLCLKITFFIVGQDAALDKNSNYLSLITENGHDVGNHSYSHDVWITDHDKKKMAEEIYKSADKIENVTGVRPTGFRGPGFVYSRQLLKVLFDYGYSYDATLLPTYIGPLARRYFFWKSSLSNEEKKKRRKIFSSMGESLLPVKPFQWIIGSGAKLLEIPVSTIPVLKIPFHLSYLIYLSSYSELLMKGYLKIAIFMCKLTRTEPSFLLHPLDFLSTEDVRGLDFFPGMRVSSKYKRQLAFEALSMLRKHYRLVCMAEHSRSILYNVDLPSIFL